MENINGINFFFVIYLFFILLDIFLKNVLWLENGKLIKKESKESFGLNIY